MKTSFTNFLLTLSAATVSLASPIELETRQCFAGSFQGGGCNVYRTDLVNQPGAPNCADNCIAEGIRQNCCGPTSWSLEMDGCPSYSGFGLSTCQCTC